MKPRALNLVPLSLPRPRVFSERVNGGHGLWGDAPRRTEQLYSNHIKHPTNPAGRLGIINLQPSCACRTRLNPAPSVAGRPGGAGPADEREMLGVASGHAGDKSRLVMRSLPPSRRTRRLLAQANRRSGPVVGCQAAGDENKTTETTLAAPWRRSQRPSSPLAGRTGRGRGRVGRQRGRPELPRYCVFSARVFLQVSRGRAKGLREHYPKRMNGGVWAMMTAARCPSSASLTPIGGEPFAS